MRQRKLASAIVASIAILAIAGCAQPPDASRIRLPSPSNSIPSAPTPDSSDSSKSPKPSTSSSPSKRPTAPPRVSPGGLAGMGNVAEELRDLPVLPEGAKAYQGPNADPPHADPYGMLVTAEVPKSSDIYGDVDEYVDNMVAQGWEVKAHYPADEDVTLNQYILERRGWLATVTGQVYKGRPVLSVFISLGG